MHHPKEQAMGTESRLDEPRDVRRREIYRFDDDTLFAYSRRLQLLRCSDDLPWAYLSSDQLISARSGQCLARRVGNIYYDPNSREALYYELP
jgi:hypothetical protein